jgi:murein L,D-transpeptidase YcbB/YkuD
MMRGWCGAILIAMAARMVGAQASDPFAQAVRALLVPRGESGDRPVEQAALARIYPPSDSRPLWSQPDGRPTVQASAAIGALASAESHGLVSEDYDVTALWELAFTAEVSRTDAARFDVGLTRSMTRFLADLRFGRIDPATVRFDMPNVEQNPIELAMLVTAVARAADAPAAVARAAPAYAGYQALERALARYRALARDTTLRAPERAATTIRVGDRSAGVSALARLLRALGDLDSTSADAAMHGSADTEPVYDSAVAAAVARFQRRHGLDPDGAIGPVTMHQLRVSLAQRVRQIELTLERWRWLPEQAPSRYVVVNIPAFRLEVFEDDPAARRPVLALNVITGQADGRHETPVFSATMREVVFRPYWDVPPNIARAEVFPMVRRRPESFAEDGYEIVQRGAPDTATVTFAPNARNLAHVAAGELRVRQRPGPANALGFIKFVFPNRYSVFLHDTPLRSLFANSRRDYSHGCVRVERPKALAELVLRGQAFGDPAAIDSIIRGSRTVHVPIAEPLTVLVWYATAVADADGLVRFYPDIYGRDVVLERALGLPAIPGQR